MHIPLTVLHTFLMKLVRRMCLKGSVVRYLYSKSNL